MASYNGQLSASALPFASTGMEVTDTRKSD
jgi:hypothetical protein